MVTSFKKKFKFNMATSRGVGIFFRQFLRQIKINRINNTVPSTQYCTKKDEITSNPFFEKYAEKIKHGQGSQRYDGGDSPNELWKMGVNVLL
jgi:hypothetical protein